MQLSGRGWDVSGVESFPRGLLECTECGEGLREGVLTGVSVVVLLSLGQWPLVWDCS